MMIRIVVAAFLLQVGPLAAYPLVDAKYKDDPEVCTKAGTLDFVAIYGGIGYEDTDFFTMLDKALWPDTPKFSRGVIACGERRSKYAKQAN